VTCPDLRVAFDHYRWEAMPHSFGVPVGCDWIDKAPDDPVFGIYTRSGSWTMDELAILFAVASQRPGVWLDIGGATGWTAAHLAKAGCLVHSIEPMWNLFEFKARAVHNLSAADVLENVVMWPLRSDQFFLRLPTLTCKGVVIDGNHDGSIPLLDTMNAHECFAGALGVALFHDARGESVKAAIRWLTEQRGFRCRPYPSCHGVAVCWRGELELPDYTPPLAILDETVWPEIKGLAA
jgi:hypothetical protein